MATKGNMTLRIEPELKRQASELFNALGMDLSTATGIFYRQAPCAATACLLRCAWTSRTRSPTRRWDAAEKDDDVYGPL